MFLWHWGFLSPKFSTVFSTPSQSELLLFLNTTMRQSLDELKTCANYTHSLPLGQFWLKTSNHTVQTCIQCCQSNARSVSVESPNCDLSPLMG